MTEGLTTPQSANADSSPLGKGSLLESGTTVGSCTVQKPPYYNKVCNYANLRKRSKPIWKAKERSD